MPPAKKRSVDVPVNKTVEPSELEFTDGHVSDMGDVHVCDYICSSGQICIISKTVNSFTTAAHKEASITDTVGADELSPDDIIKLSNAIKEKIIDEYKTSDPDEFCHKKILNILSVIANDMMSRDVARSDNVRENPDENIEADGSRLEGNYEPNVDGLPSVTYDTGMISPHSRKIRMTAFFEFGWNIFEFQIINSLVFKKAKFRKTEITVPYIASTLNYSYLNGESAEYRFANFQCFENCSRHPNPLFRADNRYGPKMWLYRGISIPYVLEAKIGSG